MTPPDSPITRAFIASLRRELDAITYSIRITTEDLTLLNARKAEIQRQLSIYEPQTGLLQTNEGETQI